MAAEHEFKALEQLLGDLKAHVETHYPHLGSLLLRFSDEARFGRRWLKDSLFELPKSACLLEVGGGLMILSTSLQNEGYSVTVLEPIGVGFSAFSELQKVVLNFATQRGIAPTVVPVKVEAASFSAIFDLAFSINVMEHVEDVDAAIHRVVHALKRGADYKFICPNYRFPYEPHFNIPTLFSKRVTEIAMRNRIFNSAVVSDPKGTWESLNWISVPRVRRVVEKMPCVESHFDRAILSSTFERVVNDPEFAARRSRWVTVVATLLVKSRLHKFFALLPASAQPIMDCTVRSFE